MNKSSVQRRLKNPYLLISIILIGAWIGTFQANIRKPLPEGISISGPIRYPDRFEFLSDLTYQRSGETAMDQEIFDRILAMIDAAQTFVVIDMFLFNDEHGGERAYRPLTQEITELLIRKKQEDPNFHITFITDEINNFYGSYTAEHLSRLERHGIQVITTDLNRLRDSNPLYSSFWRMGPQWLGTRGSGFLPHPLSSTGTNVTARSYLRLLNFKANHRKVVVTDRECLVTSANPHDASSFHSNIAFYSTGSLCSDILESERAVASFSGGEIPHLPQPFLVDSGTTAVGVRLTTEGRIKAQMLAHLDQLDSGDSVSVAMFYFSGRNLVRALLTAADRGVSIKLILDPNKDAFGREKGGVPNRQVAWELTNKSDGAIQVRWFDTHGEQFHTKLMILSTSDSMTVFGGSANLTRRNVGDFNLEADLMVLTPRRDPLALELADYFDRLWFNHDGEFTVPFEVYEDSGFFKRVLYRIQEWSGFSSF